MDNDTESLFDDEFPRDGSEIKYKELPTDSHKIKQIKKELRNDFKYNSSDNS